VSLTERSEAEKPRVCTHAAYAPGCLPVSRLTLVSFTDLPKIQTLTPLKSQKTEVIETVRKAVPVTFLFLSSMEPRSAVSRGKTGEGGTGKRDYRNSCQYVSVCKHRRFLFLWHIQDYVTSAAMGDGSCPRIKGFCAKNASCPLHNIAPYDRAVWARKPPWCNAPPVVTYTPRDRGQPLTSGRGGLRGQDYGT
jgi:hypothetical protein